MIDSELELLDKKVERMARARRRRKLVWRNLVHAGTLGLLLVLPPVIGAAIGHAAARDGGSRAAPLIGLVAGLLLGIALVVLQVRASLAHDDDDEAGSRADEPPGPPEGTS